MSGSVLEAGTNRPLAGARVSVAGVAVSATTGDGSYTLPGLPPGELKVTAALPGYTFATSAVIAQAGEVASLVVRLDKPAVQAPAPRAPVAAAPAASPNPVPPTGDPEIRTGEWVPIDRGEAEELLGRPIVTVPVLRVESIAKAATGARAGIRVAQVLDGGQRLELVISRPAFLNRAGQRSRGNERVSAIRVAPSPDASGSSAGTARYGGFLITAKAKTAPRPTHRRTSWQA